MEQSPKLGFSINSTDVKYISGLSAILVASIQEAKDRISQIEYIFCSQLYPNFQSKCKELDKMYTEAKKDSEDACKKKEIEFNLRLEKLELENKQVVEENEKLHKELMLRAKEVDDGMELQSKLVDLVQAKTTLIANKAKEEKEHEEERNVLLVDLNDLRKTVELLKQELSEKTMEVADGKKLAQNLLKKIELQSFDIMHNEEQLINCNKEKKVLEANFEKLKNYEDEVEEERKMREQLRRQIDLKGSEILKHKQQLEEHERIKELLLAKVKGLEQEVDELQAVKHSKSGDGADHAVEERDSYEKLLKQIESKASELVAEKKKRRDMFDAYKRLKSQYNYLCSKNGLTTENMVSPYKPEDETDSAKRHRNVKPSLDAENKTSNTPMVVFDTKSIKGVIGINGDLKDEKRVKPNGTSTSHCPTSSFPDRKCPSSVKSNPVVGTKRPVPGWRDTRAHQGQARHDPHDDFLDTPLENIKGNLEKVMNKEAGDNSVPEDMIVDSSDDETQDVNADKMLQKRKVPFQVVDKGSFKYVEPVRKKADREKLKGFECNQCKKFYDAVLDEGDEGNEDRSKNFRCEHHDGVSRHRYKYVPPMTPEGFWNIGFESEM